MGIKEVFLGLGLAVASNGCAVGPLPCGYTVILDMVPPSHVPAFLDAVDQWRTAVPDLEVSTAVGRCAGRHDHVLCVHGSDAATVAKVSAAHGGLSNESLVDGITAMPDIESTGAETWIDLARSSRYGAHFESQIVAHELGHAMGLEHSPNGSGPSIMRANIDDASPAVSCDDSAVWSSLRGLVFAGCAAR